MTESQHWIGGVPILLFALVGLTRLLIGMVLDHRRELSDATVSTKRRLRL